MATMSGTSFGQTLDFRPVGAIQAPFALPKCPSNGLVFSPEIPIENFQAIQSYVLSPDYQKLQKKESNYYLLYVLMKKMNASNEDLISVLLQATWEAQDTPKQYQRYAQELLSLINAQLKQEPYHQRYTMLGIELKRRLGQFKNAQNDIETMQMQVTSPTREELNTIHGYLAQQSKWTKERNTQAQIWAPNEDEN
jgi:hypothetical protein